MAKRVLNVVDVLYNQKKKVEVESTELPPSPINPLELAEVLQGSNTIVVDVAEDNEHVEVHLDADVVAKVDNSLQLPLSHTEEQLVGVDTSGGQEMVGIGEGLDIEDRVLKVTGGLKLYKHIIHTNLLPNAFGTNVQGGLVVFTTKAEEYSGNLMNVLYTNRDKNIVIYLYAGGTYITATSVYLCIIKGSSGMLFIGADVKQTGLTEWLSTNIESDTVTQVQ